MASDNDITVRKRRCKDVFDGDLAHYIPGSSQDALTYSKKSQDWAIKWPDETGDGKVDALDYSSKKWAVYTDGPVDADNNLFSSKWYAQYAEMQANISITWANKSQEWAESDNVIEGTDNSYSSKHWSGVSKGWADDSLSYSVAADNSRLLAFEWAEKMDGPVTGNQYSAKYWAGKAEELSGGAEEWSEVSHNWANGGLPESSTQPAETDTFSSLYWAYLALTSADAADGYQQAAYQYKEQAKQEKQEAELARINAESARDAARTAQSLAETAQGKAEDALALAEDAQEASEAARDRSLEWAESDQEIIVPGDSDTHYSSKKYSEDALDTYGLTANVYTQTVQVYNDTTVAAADAHGHADDAMEASLSAQAARTAAETANSQAQQASSSAISAKDAAEGALEAAETAQGIAEEARDSAVQAEVSALAARDRAHEWAESDQLIVVPGDADTHYSSKKHAGDALDTYGLTADVYALTVGVYNDTTVASAAAHGHADDAMMANESAQEAKDDAIEAQGLAESALTAAEDARDLALEWADNNYGVPVTGTDSYSSKHWSIEALNKVASLGNVAMRDVANTFTQDNQFDGDVTIGQPAIPGTKAKCQLDRTCGNNNSEPAALIDTYGRQLLIPRYAVSNRDTLIQYINTNGTVMDVSAEAAEGTYLFIKARKAGTYANGLEYYATGQLNVGWTATTTQGTKTAGTAEVKAQCQVLLTSNLDKSGAIIYTSGSTVKGIAVLPQANRTLQGLANLINEKEDLDFTASVEGNYLVLTNKLFGADTTVFDRTGCFNGLPHIYAKQGTVTPGTEDIPSSGNKLTLNGESVPTHFGNNEYAGINIFTGPVGILSTGSFTNNGVTVLNGDTIVNGTLAGLGLNNFVEDYRISSHILSFEDLFTAECETDLLVKEIVSDWNTRNNWRYLLSNYTGNLSSLFGSSSRTSTANGDYLYLYAPKVTSASFSFTGWYAVKELLLILPSATNLDAIFGSSSSSNLKSVTIIAPKAQNQSRILDWASGVVVNLNIVVGSFSASSDISLWFTLYGSCSNVKQLSINDSALATRTTLSYRTFTGLLHHVVKLPALVDGDLSYCKLDKESVLSIVNSLKTAGEEEQCTLKIGMLSSLLQDQQVQDALTNLAAPVTDGGKGWTVTTSYK